MFRIRPIVYDPVPSRSFLKKRMEKKMQAFKVKVQEREVLAYDGIRENVSLPYAAPDDIDKVAALFIEKMLIPVQFDKMGKDESGHYVFVQKTTIK